jgi:hypothetical protein
LEVIILCQEEYSLRAPVEFADLGHKLFRTTPETYPIAFVPGDAFDPKHLEVVTPFMVANAPTGPPPDLRSLTSLNPLRGRVSAIHATSFFHLFNEEKQFHLARALAGLLSPEPGSMIFGLHLGLAEKGFTLSGFSGKHHLFCHSPESWAQVWDGLVFEKGMVKVQAKLVHIESKSFEGDEASTRLVPLLSWSVTRLAENTPTQQKSTQLGHEVPLDEWFYELTDDDRIFLKQQTGMQDDEELKAHILQVQAEAYKVCRLGN